MAAAAQRPSLVVIVGPTASGKSDLAVKVAKKFIGEIIAADSRTVYKGMDIGTAKPPLKDQKAVPHWGLDLLKPGHKFTAADFKKYAETKIEDIINRGKLPIVVGGTGLYVDSLLFDFSFVQPHKLPLYQRLSMPLWSINKLQKVIQQNDWPMPENSRNRRHLINISFQFLSDLVDKFFPALCSLILFLRSLVLPIYLSTPFSKTYM